MRDKKKMKGKKWLALLLSACMLTPLCGMQTEAEESYTRVTDPVTVYEYQQYYGNPSVVGNMENVTSEYAGGIWTDKSVHTEAIQYRTTAGATEDSGEIPAPSDNNFLVELSAIASTQKLTGHAEAPIDVMIILDMSSSMYNGGSRDPATVDSMIQAVNSTLDSIFTMNNNNRAGVTIYYGGAGYESTTTKNDQSTYEESRCLVLPLDRYTRTNSTFLSVIKDGTELNGIEITDGVKNSAGIEIKNQNEGNNKLTDAPFTDIAGGDTANWRGTFSQAGIWDAMDQFLAASTTVEMSGTKMIRQPVFVFMADGSPTAATENFSGQENFTSEAFADADLNDTGKNATMGNNTVTLRCPAQSDFVTQLTAAYAKKKVTDHYYGENVEKKSALYYTIGLALTPDNLALNILDPLNPERQTEEETLGIIKYWDDLVADGSVQIESTNTRPVSSTFTHKVSKVEIDVPGEAEPIAFPNNVNQRNYVDKYFQADEADQLADAFQNVLAELVIKESYIVTDVINDNNHQGKISFIDKIGKYMEVKNMTGVLLNGVYGSGAVLASNFRDDTATGEVAPENQLGTVENPTSLGIRFAEQVSRELGIPYDADKIGSGENMEFVKVIQNAYASGQLSYESDTVFSNYIGWYAKKENDQYQYLEPWNDKDKTEVAPPEAKYRIKSYFYLTNVDSGYATLDTNVMYLTVWVVEKMETGEQMVVFSVPASLIPTMLYTIGLDQDGNVRKDENGNWSFTVTGAEYPIRLIYEVGLKDGINENTVLSKVDDGYLKAEGNKNEETGEIYFYTNQYDVTKVGSDSVNTYSYFSPSKQNDRYYYLVDSAVYVEDGNGGYVPYTGAEAPESTDKVQYYDKLTYYAYGKAEPQYKYRPVANLVLDKLNGKTDTPSATRWTRKQNDLNWYIPAGTPLAIDWDEEQETVARFNLEKTSNNTGTLKYADYPFVSLDYDRTVEGSQYIVAATLGNNGRIGLIPKTGNLKVEKQVDVASGTPDANLTFPITVTLSGEGIELGSTFPTKTVTAESGADGVEGSITVTEENFTENELTVTFDLKDGESVEIQNLPVGVTATVTETISVTGKDKTYEYFDETPTYEDSTVEGNNKYGIVVTTAGKTENVKVINRYEAPGEFTFTKVAAENKEQPLAGAMFNLYELQCTTEEHDHSGLIDVKTPGCWVIHQNQTVTSGENGIVEFTELFAGKTYRLVETKAPNGRVLPAGQWAVSMEIVEVTENEVTTKKTVIELPEDSENPEGSGGKLAVVGDKSNTPAFAINPEDDSLKLPNMTPMDIPTSGGSGIWFFVIEGCLLMSAGATSWIAYQKMSRKKSKYRVR